MFPVRLRVILLLFLTVNVLSDKLACSDHCTESCCELTAGEFQCCPFVNGVCCADGKSCCPQGSTCEQDGLTCTYSSGVRLSTKLLTKKNGESGQLELKESLAGTPVVCPDRTSACPANSTCCSMAGGSWGCCDKPNAVCCSDGLHCCPKGTLCNADKRGCDPVKQLPVADEMDQFLSLLFRTQLGRARDLFINVNQPKVLNTTTHVWNAMAYSGVQCDDGVHECPNETTCCLDSFGLYACCPFPRAVCCADKLHCCPENYDCDEESGRCLSNSPTTQRLVERVPSKDLSLKDEQLCPDEHSRCPSSYTCCQLADKTWGCCPLPEAVCCSDGLHCCPSGYRCDSERKTCVKHAAVGSPSSTSTPPPAAKITCPNIEFQCDNGTTCCSLPNDEWACCPFAKAVCCPDGLNCCPHGTRCDGPNQTCLPVTNTNEPPASVPWAEKLPATQRPVATEQPKRSDADISSSARNNTCPDRRYICQDNQTCCPAATGGYGCCPFANGTCCDDRRHCCPVNTTCGLFGLCIRQLGVQSRQTVSQAYRMRATIRKSALPLTVANPNLGKSMNAEFCGDLCPNGGFCCADASGQPRRKCCPATAGVCCSDGEYCCPRGTRCVGNGQCQSESQNVRTSFAPYLVPAMDSRGSSPGFLKGLASESFYFRALAKATTPARVNPMFLLDYYYRKNARKFTVCPDLERTCGLDQQCCSSLKNHYACAPKGSTCCPYTAETYCPSGTVCSHDGILCEAV